MLVREIVLWCKITHFQVHPLDRKLWDSWGIISYFSWNFTWNKYSSL